MAFDCQKIKGLLTYLLTYNCVAEASRFLALAS